MVLTVIGLGGLTALASLALLVRRVRARRTPEPVMPIVERQAVREVLMQNVVRLAPR